MGTKNNNRNCKDSYENNFASQKEEKTSVQMMEKAKDHAAPNVEENPIMETKDELDGSLVSALDAFTLSSPAPNVTTSNSRSASPSPCRQDQSPSSINDLPPSSLSSMTTQDTASSLPCPPLPKLNGDH